MTSLLQQYEEIVAVCHLNERERERERESSLILTNIVLAINIMLIHEFKQLDFNLSLIEEWLLVLNDLDRNLLLINQVICFDNLQNKHVVSLISY